jgi:hypothetical protein
MVMLSIRQQSLMLRANPPRAPLFQLFKPKVTFQTVLQKENPYHLQLIVSVSTSFPHNKQLLSGVKSPHT